MIFSEIYGAYYQTVARILAEAGAAPITLKRIREIVEENAFAESAMVIPEKLESGQWPLVVKEDGRFSSVLFGEPKRPLTLIEKRWLKAILRDPRVELFFQDDLERGETAEAAKNGVNIGANRTAYFVENMKVLLSDVEPLFDIGDFDYYDRYTDGDDYENPEYKQIFRTLLQAIHEKRHVRIRYAGRKGKKHEGRYLPWKIEYSEKDDKFRAIMISHKGEAQPINISRIMSCELDRLAEAVELLPPTVSKASVELELTDDRNTLERAMLHFSDLEKETERLDDRKYKVILSYRIEDETEILIRVMGFGPTIKVVAPERFVELMRERLRNQRAVEFATFLQRNKLCNMIL